MGGQPSDDGGEVERAVARHREGALYDRVKKALSAAVKLGDHIHANILGVNMRDALVVLVDDTHDIAARKSHVARIKEQRDAFARVFHEHVELRLGLDHGGHMVVIGQWHALLGAPFAKLRHLAGIDLDFVL